MNKYFLLSAMLWLVSVCFFSLSAQQIVAAEYFIDTDPGVGNGTPIPINTPADEVSGSFALDVTNLTPGFHDLYVRGLDDNGQWGFTHRQRFYVFPPPATPPAVDEEIVEAEYFIDTDPGVGNGTDIQITPGETVDGSFALDVTDLTPGFHQLYVRGRNGAGQWGFTHRQNFYVLPPPTTPPNEQIVAAEYFINTDPGVGNGIPVPIPAPGDTVIGMNVPIVITQCLDPGNHILYLRGKNAEGQWGFYASATLTIEDIEVEIAAAQHVPTSNCGITESETLLVTLTNTGPAEIPAGTVPVTVSVSGANAGTYGPFTHTAPIPVGGQAVVAATGIDLSTPGLNTLTADIDVCNDGPQGNSFSIDVTGVEGPVPSVVQPANQLGCAGEMTDPVVFTGNTPGATYEWTNDNPAIGLASSGTGDIPAFTLQNPGNVPLTATITVTPWFEGCNGVPKSFTITASPGPEAAISGDLEICVGQTTTTLTASGGVAYEWSTGEETASITVGAAGAYSVSVSDEAGCISVATATVEDSAPDIQISGAPEFCAGESTTLTATGGVSYLWNTGAETASIEVNEPGLYTVTGTDAGGCTNTASVNVAEVATVTVVISGELSICAGETTTLTATAGASYAWSTGAETQSIEVSAAGAYSVTVTSANGCTGENSVEVIVNALPLVSISGDLSLCEGETTTLTASGGTTYLWSTGDETPSIHISPLVETIYTVIVTDENGCSASASETVSVNALPEVVISGDLDICEGESTTLTASGGTGYLWSTNAETESIAVTTAGVYSVTATDGNGCEAESSATVTVNPAPALEITGDLEICEGESVTLSASAPPVESLPLVWTKALPLVLSDYGDDGGLESAVYFNWNNGAEAPAVSGDFELEYQVEVIAIGSGVGDAMFGYASIDPDPANILSLGGNGKLLYFDQGSSLYNYNSVWTNSPAPLSAAPGDIVTFTLNRTGDLVTYSIAGATPALKTGTVESGNSAPIYPVAVFYNNGCRLLSAVLNGVPLTYLWSTGDDTPSISVSPEETTTYSVTVTNENGCSTTESVTVTVNNLGPPTAFCQDITVSLSPDTYTLTAEEINDNSFSVCASSLEFSIPETVFDCSDVGNLNEVTLTVSNGLFSSACTAQVTVLDLTPPALTCPPSTTVTPAPGTCDYTIAGTEFDPTGLSDNCGEVSVVNNLNNAASLNGVMLGAGAHLITWTATDESGNSFSCQFTLTVPCDAAISGTLFRRTYGDPVGPYPGVAQATVILSGDASDTDGPTPASGEYLLFASSGDNFTIKPVKPINPTNGLDAGDATAIQQHIAGIFPGSGYVTDFFQLVAADVNKSGTITTLDATIVRQAALGNPSAINIIKNAGSWRFIPTDYEYPDPAGPVLLPAFPETRSVTGPATEQDFFGVKLGDFIQTANPLLLPQVPPLAWRTTDRKLAAGETVEVDFTASNFNDIAAYQFALDFDASKLVFEEAEVLTSLIPLSVDDNFGLFDAEQGRIRSVFTVAEGYDLPGGEPAFRLRFTVQADGYKLSELLGLAPDALAPRAYTSMLVMTDVELQFGQDIVNSTAEPAAGSKMQLLQNRPNPFERETVIGFVLPEACEAQLRVYDVSGREILRLNKRYAAGYHEETLDLESQGASGVLFCELTSPYGVLVRKMVVARN